MKQAYASRGLISWHGPADRSNRHQAPEPAARQQTRRSGYTGRPLALAGSSPGCPGYDPEVGSIHGAGRSSPKASTCRAGQQAWVRMDPDDVVIDRSVRRRRGGEPGRCAAQLRGSQDSAAGRGQALAPAARVTALSAVPSRGGTDGWPAGLRTFMWRGVPGGLAGRRVLLSARAVSSPGSLVCPADRA